MSIIIELINALLTAAHPVCRYFVFHCCVAAARAEAAGK